MADHMYESFSQGDPGFIARQDQARSRITDLLRTARHWTAVVVDAEGVPRMLHCVQSPTLHECDGMMSGLAELYGILESGVRRATQAEDEEAA